MPKFIRIYEKQILWGAAILLASLSFLVWSSVFEKQKQGDLEIYFFNVGQGDSIFLRSKDGTNILVDGGPTNTKLGTTGKVGVAIKI